MIVSLGFDPIWLGVIMVIVLEMGLISPPIGVNVFVVKSIVPDVKMETIFAASCRFWLAMAIALLVLVAFPKSPCCCRTPCITSPLRHAPHSRLATCTSPGCFNPNR